MGTTVPYRGTDHTVRAMIDLARGNRGEKSIKVRRHAEQIVGAVRPKDYASEAIAACRWWGNAGRYTRDPVHVEMLRDPERLIDDALAGKLACDCFPADTLLLRSDHSLVPISEIEPGNKIWGHDRWSLVEAVTPKGELTCDAIRLNTGTWMHLTPDHKVYVVGSSGRVERIRVADLTEGAVLLSPDRIDFGHNDMNPDEALLRGLYLSDGWHDEHTVRISGLDGHPKEAQKREVAEACARLGYSTSWHRKAIAICNTALSHDFARMGSRAPEKKALDIGLTEPAAAALLRGIMADSGANSGGEGRTFTTTSHQLAIQTRVLLKMFGVRTSMRFIADHGGLGRHPIWRLGTRIHPRWHAARVTEIERAASTVPCYDITTDDHKVYLPAHDVTVSNCDEFALAIGASCLVLGLPIQFVTVGFGPRLPGQPKIHTHVFVRAQDPRTKIWWVLDPVAGRRTGAMLAKVRQFSVFEV